MNQQLSWRTIVGYSLGNCYRARISPIVQTFGNKVS